MDWLLSIVDSLTSVFPRLLIVRTTHRAVKWKGGKKVVELGPGVHLFWPLVSEVDVFVVARRSINLPSQVLMTKDRQPVAVGGFVVAWINDPIKAFGERNWDVEETIVEISTAAIVEVVMQHSLDELLEGTAAGPDSILMTGLTEVCKRSLRQYGVTVQRCGLTDFCTCQTFKLLGDGVRRLIPEGD